MARYRESEFEENGPFDHIAAAAMAKRHVAQSRGNVTYNPNYVEPDAAPGPQEILNPYINAAPTPADQQFVTQQITGGDRHPDMIGPSRQIGATISSPDGTARRGSITATPAVLPAGFQPAQEVSRFSMPFPGAKLTEKQKQAINQAAIGEQMGLQSQLLAGEQRRNPGAFAAAYGDAIGQAADSLLPIDRRMINVMPTAEASQIVEQDRMQEASQRKRLEDYAKLPSTTKQGADDAWRQHHEQYPWSAPGGDPPKTRAEMMREMEMQEEQASQKQMMDFSAQLGLPPIPMVRNKDGRLEPALSIESLIAQQGAMQRSAASDAARQRREQFDAQLAAKRATAPKRPDPLYATPEETANWNKYSTELHTMVDQFYGDQQQQTPKPPSTMPADTPAQLEAASFGDGLAAEREFDAGRLKPEQPFTVNGVRLKFDANGVVTRF